MNTFMHVLQSISNNHSAIHNSTSEHFELFATTHHKNSTASDNEDS